MARVSIARWNLKEAGGKPLIRRIEIASGIQRWVSLLNKMKPEATRNRRCKCGGYMAGKNAFLPEGDLTDERGKSLLGVKLAVRSQQRA